MSFSHTFILSPYTTVLPHPLLHHATSLFSPPSPHHLPSLFTHYLSCISPSLTHSLPPLTLASSSPSPPGTPSPSIHFVRGGARVQTRSPLTSAPVVGVRAGQVTDAHGDRIVSVWASDFAALVGELSDCCAVCWHCFVLPDECSVLGLRCSVRQVREA